MKKRDVIKHDGDPCLFLFILCAAFIVMALALGVWVGFNATDRCTVPLVVGPEAFHE